MLLLTIAHQGEAQEFIKRKHTQPVAFHFKGVYSSGEDLLLLTGEGIQLTTLHLTSVCTYFGDRIDRVLNLGIAGSLDPSLQCNQFYGIRRVHHQFSSHSGFPPFRCKETHSRLDCVTAVHRVLDKTYAATLNKIAPIVDRELWAIGSVCQLFNLPFKSYKLISDQAGLLTDSRQIKSEATKISKHLFDFYKNLSLVGETWD